VGTLDQAALVEVAVLRDHQIPVLACVLPDLVLRCTLERHDPDVHRDGIQISQRRGEPR